MYIFIVNPASRSGHASQIWTEIETLLKERNILYRVYFTSHRGHGTKLAQQLTKDLSSRTTLIVVGGDGTVNEVLNGIEHPEHIILGYIPTGSGNDFAKGMALPSDPQKALELILSPNSYRTVDIGVLKYSEKDTEKIRKFAVSTGIGFDAAICHHALVSRLKVLLNRIHLGKLAYAFISLRELALHKPCRCRISFDNGTEVTFEKLHFAAVMNQPFEGGGFRFCPNAQNNDGKLDLCMIHDVSKIKLLFLMAIGLFGWHTSLKGVDTFRCKQVHIHTSAPMPVHADGESAFLQDAISVTCEQECLLIIAPQTIQK